jgi:hypothetical protein
VDVKEATPAMALVNFDGMTSRTCGVCCNTYQAAAGSKVNGENESIFGLNGRILAAASLFS